KPEHVIYYRDGVSEGQYYDILQTEMRSLRKAFKMISDGYNPPVTFIIVNKRHHTRAFPYRKGDADSKGNVNPGTVINTGIVDSHRFDFFLYGHSGIQGTSVPCHYTVLHNENNMSADDVQRLTYHLGYTFARCTRSVSFATPAYNAHLAARRARFFLNEGSDDESSVGMFNSSSSKVDFNPVWGCSTQVHRKSTSRSCTKVSRTACFSSKSVDVCV
ncbi:Argonaute3, partial [Phytophthora megakarya]